MPTATPVLPPDDPPAGTLAGHAPGRRPDAAEPGHTPAIDLRLVRRFLDIAAPFWQSSERWKARGLLALLALLLLGQTAFNVVFNQETGEFTSALAAADAERFWASIRRCIAIVVVAVPIHAAYYYVRDTLGLNWRRWLTRDFLDRYLDDHAFYRLDAAGVVDNPDQRIAEDINAFTQQSLYFLMVAIGAVLQMVAFTGVLWSISHELVYFLIIYAVAGTLITALGFGRPLIGLNYRQLRREADFRFGLVRLREHAEAIALEAGEAHENRGLRGLFDRAFANYRRILRWQFGLNLFQYGFSFLTLVLPSAIIAGDVLAGELEVGRAIQAAGAFAAILAALTVIVEHFESLSRFAAGIDRLHGFAGTLLANRLVTPASPRPAAPAAAPAAPPAAAPGRATTMAGGAAIRPEAPADGWIDLRADSRLALLDVTIVTPDRARTLVRGLSFDVEPGEGLMIVGASGGGKSSLLRAIAGLWRAGSGVIARPSGSDTLFLPQQPYMTTGSLRSQLLYPDDDRVAADDELLQLLDRVNLSGLAGRFGGFDAVRDWGKVLSVGEQQRLAFARALLIRPRFLMLDEATSALDAANETILYQALAGQGMTPVSVSHHPALLAFHRRVLELTGEGGWLIQDAASWRLASASTD
ncbi:MAG: ABC transporter ATP-binding protein/permease [Lautropia sp.]